MEYMRLSTIVVMHHGVYEVVSSHHGECVYIIMCMHEVVNYVYS